MACDTIFTSTCQSKHWQVKQVNARKDFLNTSHVIILFLPLNSRCVFFKRTIFCKDDGISPDNLTTCDIYFLINLFILFLDEERVRFLLE